MISRLAAVALVLAVTLPAIAVTPEDDTAIRDNVRMLIATSAVLGSLDVRAGVRDGVVVLEGRVRTLAQKREAEAVAGSARGVLEVYNRVRIDTRNRTDDAVAYDVRRAFEDRPELQTQDVRVEVEGGVATISGEVRDARLRFLAEEAASEIEGVVGVLDRLATPPQSDEVIAGAARSLLAGGGLRPVSGRIRVDVADGVVTLRGVVYRVLSRFSAERLCRGINGVRDVVNELRVVRYGSSEDVAPPEPEGTDATSDPFGP